MFLLYKTGFYWLYRHPVAKCAFQLWTQGLFTPVPEKAFEHQAEKRVQEQDVHAAFSFFFLGTWKMVQTFGVNDQLRHSGLSDTNPEEQVTA